MIHKPAAADSNARKERWVCENANAVEIDQHARVSEPGESDRIVRPLRGRWLMRCAGNLVANFRDARPEKSRRPRSRGRRPNTARTRHRGGGEKGAAIEPATLRLHRRLVKPESGFAQRGHGMFSPARPFRKLHRQTGGALLSFAHHYYEDSNNLSRVFRSVGFHHRRTRAGWRRR